jgi:hypothetical protein
MDKYVGTYKVGKAIATLSYDEGQVDSRGRRYGARYNVSFSVPGSPWTTSPAVPEMYLKGVALTDATFASLYDISPEIAVVALAARTVFEMAGNVKPYPGDSIVASAMLQKNKPLVVKKITKSARSR